MCHTQSQFFWISWNKCGMDAMWYGWAEAAGNKWNRANQSKARHKLHEDEEGYSGGLMVKIWHSRRWSSIGMERSPTFCSCPLSTNNKHRHNINLCYVFVLVLYGPVFSNLEEARKTFNCLKLCRGKSPSKNVFIIVTANHAATQSASDVRRYLNL